MTPQQVEERWTLAEAALQRGAFDDAERVARELVAAFERPDGVESAPDRRTYGMALGLLANVVLNRSGAQAAVDVFSEALARTQAEPPGVRRAFVLLNMARLLQYLKQRDYAVGAAAGAIEQADGEARAGDAKALGALLESATVLDEVGGNDSAAAPALQEAFAVLRAAGPERSRELARVRERLASALSHAGRYQEALPHAEYAVALMTARHGADSAEVGDASLTYGLALDQTGQYKDAEFQYRRALELLQRHRGAQDPTVRQVRVNLAELARVRGDLEDAERRFRAIEADDLARDDRTSRQHGRVLIGLGLTLTGLQRYPEAAEALNAALAIVAAHTGKQSAEYARVLLALGQLAQARGDYAAAVAALSEAATIRESTGHPGAAFVRFQQSLAELHLSDPDAAARRAREAIDREQQALGPHHPDVVLMQRQLVTEQARRLVEHHDDPRLRKEVLDDVERFHEMGKSMLVDLLSSLGARPLGRALADWRKLQEFHLSLVLADSARSQQQVDTAWQLVARYRSAETRALQLRTRRYVQHDPSERRDRLAELKSHLVRLDVEQRRGAGDSQLLADRRRYEEEVAHIEYELAASTNRSRLELEFTGDAPQRDEDAAARVLVVARYWRWGEDVPGYALFVLGPTAEPVRLVDLGPAPPIDALVGQFRDAVIEQAYRAAPDDTAWGRPGAALRARLIDPVRPFLRGVTRLRVLADGEVALLPWAALPRDEGGTLLDEFVITYDFALRALGDVLFEEDTGIDAPAAVIGAPAYSTGRDGARQGDVSSPFLDQFQGEGHFGPLDGVADECRAVAALLKVEPVLGADATEAAFRALRSPEVLHVATHGFYLEPMPDAEAPDSAAASVLDWRSRLQDSLDRTGLALAGANDYLDGYAAPPGRGDGIVYGSEIADQDFMRTDLVTLSACQTGLGDLAQGDGMHGLQRAFFSAGARTVVCSLWDVPDKPTSLLFTKFYARVLAGEPRGAAFHQTLLELAEAYRHRPVAWAGFVLLGRTDPLARFGIRQLSVVSVQWPAEQHDDGTPATRAERLIADAEARAKEGDADGADAALAEGLRADDVPAALRGRMLYARAGIRRKAGRWDDALADYRTLDGMAGLSPRLRQAGIFDAGTTHLMAGDWAGAVERYTAYLDGGPSPDDAAQALVNRAAAHRGLGDMANALADWGAVIDGAAMPPAQRTKARIGRAQGYLDLGDAAAALEDVKRVIDDGVGADELAEARVVQGMAFAALGRVDEATKSYQDALAVPGRPARIQAIVEQLLARTNESR